MSLCYEDLRNRNAVLPFAMGMPPMPWIGEITIFREGIYKMRRDNQKHFAGVLGLFTPESWYTYCHPPENPSEWIFPDVYGRFGPKPCTKGLAGLNTQYSYYTGNTVESTHNQSGTFAEYDIPKDVLPLFERFSMLGYSLWKANTVEEIIESVTWFAMSLTNQSVVGVVVEYIRNLLTTEQGGFQDFIDVLKKVRDEWTIVTNSPFFDRIAQFLSCIVALGLCDATTVDFDIGGVKLFAVQAKAAQLSALSLGQAFLDSIVFFLEGGYECFQKKSIRPLLCCDSDVEKFMDECDQISIKSKLVRTGNLEKLGMGTESEYDKLLQDTIVTAGLLIKKSTVKSEKLILERKLLELKSLNVDFQQFKGAGGMREAPWCIGVWGNSSVGKSSITGIIASAILHYNGFPATKDFIYTLNMNDAYMSGYRSYILGIIIDDMGNTKPNFVKSSPTEPVIDIVNNVKHYANMAELELKGKISVEPKVVIVTKNPKDGGAAHYSMEPVSIARRERYLVKPTPRPEYTTNNMLDSNKVMARYGCIPAFPDVWTFDVEKAYPIIQENGPAEVGYEEVAIGIDIFRLLEIFYDDSKQFFEMQKSLVANANGVSEALLEQSCKICKKLHQCCLCDDGSYKQPSYEHSVVSSSSSCSNEAMSMSVSEGLQVHEPEQPRLLLGIPNFLSFGKSPNVVEQSGKLAEWVFSSWCSKKFAFVKRTTKWLMNKEEVTVKHLEKGLNVLEKSLPLWILNLFPKKWTEGPLTDWVFEMSYAKTLTKIGSLHRGFNACGIAGLITTIDWGALVTRGISHPRGIVTLMPGLGFLTVGGLLGLAFYGTEEEDSIKETRDYIWTIGGLVSFTLMPKNFSVSSLLMSLSLCSVFVVGTLFLNKLRKGIRGTFDSDNIGVETVVRNMRQRVRMSLQSKCLIAAAILGAAKLFQTYQQSKIVVQGKLNPFSFRDILKRDSEVNVWKKPVISETPVHPRLKTMTHDQVCNKVFNNLCYMETRRPKFLGTTAVAFCDALFICSNVAIIPYHMVHEGQSIKCKFYRHGPDTVGGIFEHLLSEETIERIPNTDLCLIWVPSGGDWADIRHFLCQELPVMGPMSMVYKTDEGEKEITEVFGQFGEIEPTDCKYYGGQYNFVSAKRPAGTFNGLCMAVAVSQRIDTQIWGFHLAGSGRLGFCGTLTLQEFEMALSKLSKKDGIVLSCSSGNMPTNQYGIDFQLTKEIHRKSPTNFLEQGNFSMYGSIIGRTKAFSQVRVSLLSEHVLDICSVPNKWGPPKFKQGGNNYPFQASLQYSSYPMTLIPVSLLSKARDDYVNGIVGKITRVPGVLLHLKPLSKDAIVNGIDGLRFIDSMNANSSPGFPLSGPKKNYMTENDGRYHLDDKFFEMAEEMEYEMLQGRRPYAIFKACLKDEPTPLNKDKVRVFCSAPIALQILVRKYFLPLARILSIFPLDSECAVGINARSPEWQEMSEFIVSKGKERILAGDYSKYDLKMSAQLTLAAFDILIEISELGGYTERDRTIMRGIATEIAYPLVAYNGDLIKFHGTNPSGHNMTVYVNSIANSLLCRCTYFKHYPEGQPFRMACSLMTYGDDFKGSVVRECPKLNHLTHAKEISEYGMGLTMPNKKDTPTKYSVEDGISDVDFLKRTSNFIPELDCIIGRLAEDSIFKSLHNNMKSKVTTEREICASVIDSALCEWVAFGREHYTMRWKQMREISQIVGISHMIHFIGYSFDDHVKEWKEKYNQSAEPQVVPPSDAFGR